MGAVTKTECRPSTWLTERGLLVGDGAMGTLLQDAGLPPGGCPELFNAEKPDVVQSILEQYRDAGAELLQTNTFGGTPHKLAAYGIGDRCEELNRAGAEIARRAAGDKALVLGSIGPAGALLEPYGPLKPKDAAAGFDRQIAGLAQGGVDALCVETMIDIEEAVLAVDAGIRAGLSVIATMTFELTPRGFFTVMGVDVATAARELESAGACILGTNCGSGPDTIVRVVGALREVTDLPLMVQPNAGLPELREGEVFYPESPDTMAGYVKQLVSAGASIVGGCCGTTPEHTRMIAAAVRELRQSA